MKFTQERKEKIIHYLLQKIDIEDREFIKKTAENFSISLATVYRYLKELQIKKIISNDGSGEYKLVDRGKIKSYVLTDNLEEDIVYEDVMREFINEFSNNIRKIWQYSFSEMFNNAIDHSESENIFVHVRQNYLYTEVVIMDEGVGIFNKICNYFNYSKIEDAITELFKGKLTTDPERHSGEGIFFTSRIMDKFVLWSDNKIFTHDYDYDRLFDVEKVEKINKYQGTYLVMRLSNYSKKEIIEVFDKYSSVEGGFTVTSIPIKNMFDNAYPVSRSQAKRLYNRLDSFEEVILDFEGVESIGQGFAHELFVVFQREHPEVKIEIKNENEEVKKMIHHVCCGTSKKEIPTTSI